MRFENLIEDGYQVHYELLSDTLRERLRADCVQVAVRDREAGCVDDTGVSIPAGVHPKQPLHWTLIRTGAELLESYGIPNVRYLSGAIIPKHPNEPMRPWHVDWWAWEDEAAVLDIPPAVGVLFYLDKARSEDGALMVVPQSHHRSVDHHEKFLGTCLNPPEFDILEVPAGGIVLLDSRVMHAVTASERPDTMRICITLWYMTQWDKLSGRVKATVRQSVPPDFHQYLYSLYPEYDGRDLPWPHVKVPQFRSQHD